MKDLLIGRVQGWSKGKLLDTAYRVILSKNEEGKFIVTVKSRIEDEECQLRGQWVGTGGQWYLGTILENGVEGYNDKIYIDYGQDWYVTGMKEIIKTILTII